TASTPRASICRSTMRSRTDARWCACIGLLLAACTKPTPPRAVARLDLDAGGLPAPTDAGVGAQSSAAAGLAGPGESALVLSVGGVVEVQRGGKGEWLALAVGDPVRAGDQIRTSPDGHLELSFGAARVRVHEGSQVELTVLEPHELRANVTGATEAGS